MYCTESGSVFGEPHRESGYDVRKNLSRRFSSVRSRSQFRSFPPPPPFELQQNQPTLAVRKETVTRIFLYLFFSVQQRRRRRRRRRRTTAGSAPARRPG